MLTLSQIKQFYPKQENISERNMLREYLQYKILEIVFNSSYAQKLSFIGGTAIRMVYGSDRFSEDLDFDHFGLSKNEFQHLSNSVVKELTKEGFELETKFSLKEAWRCYLKFKGLLLEYGLSGHKKEKLTIQIDTTKQDFNIATETRILNRFGVFVEVRVNPGDVLLSQKISAVLGRKRLMGRDLYDISFLASLTKPQMDYLKDKCGVQNIGQLKSKVQERLDKYNLNNLAQDILPFVADRKRLETVRKFDQWLQGWEIS